MDDYIIAAEKVGPGIYLARLRVHGGTIHKLTTHEGEPLRFPSSDAAEIAAARELVRQLNHANVPQQFLMKPKPAPPAESAPPAKGGPKASGPRHRVIVVDVKRNSAKHEANKLFKGRR